jgi:hypothetical protein
MNSVFNKDSNEVKALKARIASLESDLRLSSFENPALLKYRTALELISLHDGINAAMMTKNFYIQVAKEALK